MENLKNFTPDLKGFSSRPSVVVTLLIKNKNTEYQLLLLRRKKHMRAYPGDWCFPGGRFERKDHSLENTAWRELREETGIVREQAKLITQLNDFYNGKGELVRPFVVEVNRETFENNFRLDTNEIAETAFVNLSVIKNLLKGSPPGKSSTRSPAYFLPIENQEKQEYLWGLSASILMHMNNIINKLSLSVDYGINYLIKK